MPGQAVMNAFFIVSLTTFAFFSEFGCMTWDRLRASPATSLEIVLGKAIPRVAMVVVQFVRGARGRRRALRPAHPRQRARAGPAVARVLDLARAARRRGHRGLPHRAAGERVRVRRAWCCSARSAARSVPFSVLPQWAQTVAPATPTYWAMRGFRSVILDGRGLGAMAAPIVRARGDVAGVRGRSRCAGCASTTAKTAWV